jgi:hypothetical protein
VTTALTAAVAMLVCAAPAGAHVGNQDVFEEVTAGQYKLFVTIRTPTVIPGVATVEVRSFGAPVDGLTVTPLPLTGEASKHPPTPDAMKRSKDDAQFFTGQLWLMATGSWQVRLGISGAAGTQTTSVPVAAAATEMLKMQRPMGFMLGALGLLLVIGFAGIVGAAVMESVVKPGVAPDAARRRHALVASGIALVAAVVMVALGQKWWDVEAADYAAEMHRNSVLEPTLTGDELKLGLSDPVKGAPGGWRPVNNTDMLLDHGHPMHLYAIRWPEMDVAFHLHPQSDGKSGLAMKLPAMPAGQYKLFGDVVFLNGFPETETATLTVPVGFAGGRLSTDDASAMPPGVSAGELGPVYRLPDGYSMKWDNHPNNDAPIVARMPYLLRFTLLDGKGKPAGDMQPYLGMAGHAAFVKDDGTTFAHTHPEGSAAMPAVMLADASTATFSGMGAMEGMGQSGTMAESAVNATVEFPYGFPSEGKYRVFVQMKHGSVVETGVFDAAVR